MRGIEYSVSSSFCNNYFPRTYKTRNICRSTIQIVTIANGFTQISLKQHFLKFRCTNFKQQGNLNSQNKNFHFLHHKEQPIPSTARSNAWVCGRSLPELWVLIQTGEQRCLSVASVVCCQVEASASG